MFKTKEFQEKEAGEIVNGVNRDTWWNTIETQGFSKPQKTERDFSKKWVVLFVFLFSVFFILGLDLGLTFLTLKKCERLEQRLERMEESFRYISRNVNVGEVNLGPYIGRQYYELSY